MVKTRINVSFRIARPEIWSSLPSSLHFLSAYIRDSPPVAHGFELSQALCWVDPSCLESLIEWGRQRRERATYIRLLRIEDFYDEKDLAGLPAVEMLHAEEMDDDVRITNFTRALRGEWDCNRCNRSTWKQMEDFQVRPARSIDFQKTALGDWIISTRAQDLLRDAGLETRELAGQVNWRQMLVSDHFRLEVEQSSMSIGHPCPSCARPVAVHRRDLLEGSYLGHTEITICRDLPLAVSLPSRAGWTFSTSDLEFGAFTRLPPVSRAAAGDRIKLEQRHIGGCTPGGCI